MSELHDYNSYIEFLKYSSKQRPLDKLANGILQAYHKNQELKAENEKLKDALINMVCQFACWGNGGLITGGLSALEYAFEVLGWDEPHEMKSMQCDEPGCNDKVTCGWPSKDGYRNTCYKHKKARD